MIKSWQDIGGLVAIFSWWNWFYFVWMSSNFEVVKTDSCYEYEGIIEGNIYRINWMEAYFNPTETLGK